MATKNKAAATEAAKQDPAIQARRTATTQANRGAIDFSAGKSVHELASAKAERSRWVQRLEQLAQGIEAGQGEYDTYYRIGAFTTTTGARTVLNTLSKKSLAREYLVETRIVANADGTRSSELWAGLPAPVAEGGDAA